jgi:hypothetical protein
MSPAYYDITKAYFRSHVSHATPHPAPPPSFPGLADPGLCVTGLVGCVKCFSWVDFQGWEVCEKMLY